MARIPKKTKRMVEIEKQYRRPIDKLLKDLYADLGSMEAVARALGVNIRTVWVWMECFDVQRRKWMLPPEDQDCNEKAS